MLRAPTWITSATSSTGSRSRASISSVTIGRPLTSLASASSRRPSTPEPLEGVRRGARLVGAAAQHVRAGGLDDVGGLEQLVARLDGARAGDQGEVVAADLRAADVEDRRLAVLLLAGELVRLEDRDDLRDAGLAVQLERADADLGVRVADRADEGHLLAAARVGGAADRLDAVDHRLDLVLGCLGLHDDQHSFAQSFSLLDLR